MATFKPSIDNIFISGYLPTWEYQKHDVVYSGNYFFVSSWTGDSFTGRLTYASNQYWKRFDDVSGWVFNDVWTPTYEMDTTITPNPRVVMFGDGYAQRTENSIFSNLLSFPMQFNNIDDRELKSLMAYFEYKGGVDYFVMNVNPFTSNRKFIAGAQNHTYNGYNLHNYSVEVKEYIMG